MGQKLHRGRRSVFKRRSPALRIIATGLLAVAIVAVGFLGAKYLFEHPLSTGQPDSTGDATTTTSGTTTTTTTVQTPVATGLTGGVKAFWLPHSALTDPTALAATLKSAADAGFDSLVVDMKDGNGTLYYRSATERAEQVNSFAADALTAAELKTLFTTIKEAGLRPIARVYAFKDNAAARVLADARVTPTGNSGWVWYDNNPANGGKAWLNPYADAAHTYVIDIAKELRDAGAAAIMLDGVQFPNQVSGASFGSTDATKGRSEVLTAFVKEAEALLGDGCPVILSCTADSARGEKTQVYGGNPLTFGATAAAPVLTAQEDTAGIIRQMATRIKVIAKEDQPLLTPVLQAENLSAATLKALVTACAEGGADSYILYAPSGVYDFAGLQ